MTEQAIVWLDRLVDMAVEYRISDLHLRFVDDNPPTLTVRARRDGQLVQWGEPLTGQVARAVTLRIKSLANVGSGQIRKAEEGRYPHRLGAGKIPEDTFENVYEDEVKSLPRMELRLAVLPTGRGETMIMRLPSVSAIPALADLGFSPHNYNVLQKLFGYANGLTLFAGPMGAGKTTSMYSALTYLGGADKAVYSVEDPIERFLDDVEQIEVNEEAGNDYRSILRSMRRADLQVMLLGEVRDQPTSMAAIQISIAGARVISSIHANDSVGAMEAMVTLSGAPPLQVLQSLRGVVSQRLVKTLCKACNKAGCAECMMTGYRGRAAIHEVLHITPELSSLMVRGAPRHKLLEMAKEQGMMSLEEDAKRLLSQNLTDWDAVNEVLGSGE